MRTEQSIAAGAMRAAALGRWSREVVLQTPSWLVSTIVHMAIFLVLAVLSMPEVLPKAGWALDLANAEEIEEIDYPPPPIPIGFNSWPMPVVNALASTPDVLPAEPFEPGFEEFLTPEELCPDRHLAPGEISPNHTLPIDRGGLVGIGARGPGSPNQIPGATPTSERAVALGLKWLAEHQMPDGGWSFAHHLAPNCQSQCRNPGNLPEARIAATGLALLPFLGAGQTHKRGKYKSTVRGGLYFLVSQMKVDAKGGSLSEPGGRMYSHGIASIVLCEALAMTRDKGLQAPAQQVIHFTAYAQDPVGGGWRYEPRQPGDTSVVGWQLMALKSGHMAYLHTPALVIKRADHFLDTVQTDSGAAYGYTSPGAGQATTAIGLLCRMYLGWQHDHPSLQRGVEQIGRWGPSKTNCYYDYYATQVMRHWGGPLWEKWNPVMRDQLVDSQATRGHEEGSWYMTNGHGATRGGRLYCTAMSTMILEVYYRHLPIYRKQSTDEAFPLD